MRLQAIEDKFSTEFERIGEASDIPSYPIYVPSKKRPSVKLTSRMLDRYNVPYLLVVEPQDYDDYLKYYPTEKLLCMDKNDQGIYYVRNFCKNHSTNLGHTYHWQIDDNIGKFFVYNPKRTEYSAGKCLSFVESFTTAYKNVGMSSLTHFVFAWTKKDYIGVNLQCYSCVLVNNGLNTLWRDGIIEDTDYSLQVLTQNYCTLLFNKICMEKKATGTIKGGNTDSEHAGDRRLIRSLKLQETWPIANFKVTNQYGRVKVKPSRVWVSFKQIPIGQDCETSTLDKWIM